MADTYQTLADVAVFDLFDIGGISNVLDDAPLIANLYAETTPGQDFRYERKLTNPTVGFRAQNTGRDFSTGTHETIIYPLAILDCSFAIDVAVAAADRRGSAVNLAMNMEEHMRAGFYAWEDQIINGTDATNGFSDLPGQIDASMTLADDTPISGDTSGAVFAIRSGPLDVGLTLGETGRITVGDTIVQNNGGANNNYPVYYTPITMWTGLTVKSTYSAAYKNVAVTVDDDLLADLYALFPVGRKPTHFVMSRDSQKKLQQSRTATSPTGQPAAFPSEWTGGLNGIPIITSEAITVTTTP